MRSSYPQADFNKYIIGYDGYCDYWQCYVSFGGGYYPWAGYSWYNPFIARNSWLLKSANKSMLFPFFLNH